MLQELLGYQVQFFCRIENMEVPQGKEKPRLTSAFSHRLSLSKKPLAKEGSANISDFDFPRPRNMDPHNLDKRNRGKAKDRRY